MTIIQIEPIIVKEKYKLHPIQSQSGRAACWLDGWIEVPSHLESKVWATMGHCNLVINDDVLVDVIETERPDPDPEPPRPVSDMEQLRADVDYIALIGGIEL